jgi:hypothetical protein
LNLRKWGIGVTDTPTNVEAPDGVFVAWQLPLDRVDGHAAHLRLSRAFAQLARNNFRIGIFIAQVTVDESFPQQRFDGKHGST